MPFWAYILSNPQGKLYVGHTNDLDRRLKEHNDPAADSRKFAPKHRPWTLLWSEPHPSRADALRRERQLKAYKSKVFLLRLVAESRQRRD